MPYQAKLVLDSITEWGIRLTTFELTYPLIVHNELLTHRALGRSDELQYDQWLEFSRNSSSNRALSPKKVRDAVANDPYIPFFLKSTSGMVGGEPLSDEDQKLAQKLWLNARDAALYHFDLYDNSAFDKIHKQHRNRLLGPFQFITTVVTGNAEIWEHFFSLRDHPAAQPEIALVARMAHELFDNHTPNYIPEGDWHLPYVSYTELLNHGDNRTDCILDIKTVQKISVVKCASSSYLRQDEEFTIEKIERIYKTLYESKPPHGSPFEHVAQSTLPKVRSGNFVGWKQLRKELGV